MGALAVSSLIALGLVVFTMPALIRVAQLKHLVDEPGDVRKLHARSIPTVGGVSVYFGWAFAVLVGLALFAEPGLERGMYLWVLAAALVLFFIGLKDDIVGLSPSKKLLAHLAVGTMLVVFGEFRITTFSGLFGLETLPEAASVAFSLFVYIVVVNAFNLIDGIDGLAAGYGVLAMMGFAVWFTETGNLPASILAAATAGALAGFIVFNFAPARIFLGDCGSLPMGMVVYTSAVTLVNTPAAALPCYWPDVSAPLVAMGLTAYPLLDTLRVFGLRTFRGRSPFAPDRNHLHHRLLLMNWGHQGAAVFVYAFTALYAVLPIALARFAPGLGTTGHFLVLLLGSYALFLPVLRRTRFAQGRVEVGMKR
jgi:UDP-N-acetylmuramyl pentapeptide phosphotransferase/UDP-N-acetylglucosamine-1-phosphate transferase